MATQLASTAPAEHSTIPPTYDYRAELLADVAIGLRIAAEARGKKSDLQRAGEALDDASSRFLRQAKRPVICATAFARAERRYLQARETYRALLAAATGEAVADLERRIAA